MSDLNIATIKAAYEGHRNATIQPGVFGIEVEVESTVPLDAISTQHWITKTDRSLRFHGYEYVSPRPLLKTDVSPALDFLFKRLNKTPTVIKNSPRTSIHVHRNVESLTPLDVWKIATAYWLMEPLLFKFCGQYREGNLFCLRSFDAKGIIDTCIRDLGDRPFCSFLNNDHIRYAGLNLTAVPKFGSVEFRGMSGTYDFSTITLWINLLETLCTNAVEKFTSPQHIMSALHDRGAETLIATIFGDYANNVLIKAPDPRKDVFEAAKHIIPFVYATNWEEYPVFTKMVWGRYYTDNPGKPRGRRQITEAALDWANIRVENPVIEPRVVATPMYGADEDENL